MRNSRRFLKSLLTSSGWWAGVAVAIMLHMLAHRLIDDKNREQFEFQTENAQLAIQTRVNSYIDVLRGTAALFDTGDLITRDQFHDYVKGLDLEHSFPGITSLNFARRVAAADKAAFEAAVRADTSLDRRGHPDFAIKPAGDRPEYHVLIYLEPSTSSQGQFGFDISSNPRSAHSFSIARDDGQPISSGRLIRIEGPNRHIGLAVRIPVYRRGLPLNTLEQRRAAWIGSVGAGYDVGKLMLGAVDPTHRRQIRIRLYDAGPADARAAGTSNPEHLLFDSAAAAGGVDAAASSSGVFTKRVSMTVGRRIWETEFSAPASAFASGFDKELPWLVLAVGLIASVMLYSIYYSLITARRHAMELAKGMTRDLRDSEASLAEAQQMAHLGSWLLDPRDMLMDWSVETYRIFGMRRTAAAPHYSEFIGRIHADDRERVREGLQHALDSGEEFSIEHRIFDQHGTLHWVHTIARRGQQRRNALLRGTMMDITERKQAVEALKRSEELLRELTAYQDRVKEDERKRIAREIHDELGQTLLALRIDVSMLEARTGKSHPRLNQKVREALQHIDATVKTIRTIINNLRPAVLDLGLYAAIEWQVSEFRRLSGIDCDLVMDGRELAVDDARATSLFRILQESLTNVIRHAHASKVVVQLFHEGSRLVMKITDNGVGISQDLRKPAHTFGLIGVEERILALEGNFTIHSAPGQGTTLTVYIPLETTNSESLSKVA
jgi:PAS domain S-box-containing protein